MASRLLAVSTVVVVAFAAAPDALAQAVYSSATRTVSASATTGSPQSFSSVDLLPYVRTASIPFGGFSGSSASINSTLLADRVVYSGGVSASSTGVAGGQSFFASASSIQAINLTFANPTSVWLEGTDTFGGISFQSSTLNTIKPVGGNAVPIPAQASALLLPAGDYTLNLEYRANASPSGIFGQVNYDRTIRFVPTPGAAALLVLGAGVAARRRRN